MFCMAPMKFIERCCWGFFTICVLIEAHWTLLHGFRIVGWTEPDAAGWAAWVQAIGSITAIGVAIWIGDYQSKRAKEQAIHMDGLAVKRRHAALCSILDEAHVQCLRVAPEFSEDHLFGTYSFIHYNERSFNDAISTLEEIPLHELDSYNVVAGISGLRDRMISIKQIVAYAKSTERDKELEPDSQIIIFGNELCEEAGDKYKLAITSLGGQPVTEF